MEKKRIRKGEIGKCVKERKNMKKKSKAPIIVIIIILLAAAGFGYWKFVYQPQQLAQYELTDTEVETALVAETDWYDDKIDEYREVFAAMAENESSYYIIESLGVRDEDNWKPRFKVYQTNKAEFDEKTVMDTEKAIKEVDDGISKFLNYSHNSLPASLYGNVNNDGIFGKLDVSSEAQALIDPQFGSSVAEYFNSHELALKCDDCTVEQIGVQIDPDGLVWYCFNITANVLTESCTGDMNDLGIFANEGETKQVKVNVLCSYEENSKELFAEFMLIE